MSEQPDVHSQKTANDKPFAVIDSLYAKLTIQAVTDWARFSCIISEFPFVFYSMIVST